MTHTTFYDWLVAQNERDDSVGDLARDVRRDLTWPKDKPDASPNQSYRRCQQYLALQSGESSSAMNALEQAIAEHGSGISHQMEKSMEKPMEKPLEKPQK